MIKTQKVHRNSLFSIRNSTSIIDWSHEISAKIDIDLKRNNPDSAITLCQLKNKKWEIVNTNWIEIWFCAWKQQKLCFENKNYTFIYLIQ